MKIFYELQTNDGREYRESEPKHSEMTEYIKSMKALGWSLGDIVFSWRKIHVK